MRMLTPYWKTGTLASDLFEDMDRFFADFARTPHTDVARAYPPHMEVNETDNQVAMSVDLPGMKREDIKVELQDSVLTISGERKRGDKAYGFFRRSFTLPASVDAGKVEARYQDGVLELVVPKVEAAKPRRIEIQSGKSGVFSKLLGAVKDGAEMKEVGPGQAS